MIVQNVGADGSTDFTFTVHRHDYKKALETLRKTAGQLAAREVTGDDKIAKISVVGVGMRSHAGIASQMFKTLADEGINIQMISTYLTGDMTVGLIWSIMAGATANYVYYWHCREHINDIKRGTGSDPEKLDEALKASGGVQSYVIWIGVALYLLFAVTMFKMVQDGPPDGEQSPGKPAKPSATSSV